MPGTTRRLLSSSSVSVRMKKAPISSIQMAAGRPSFAPQASRRALRNSRFGIGLGAHMLMAPSRVSCSMHQLMIRNKSSTCSQLTYWLPGPCVPPRPKRAMFRNASYTPPLPGPKTIGSRMAIRRVSGVAAANNAASQRFTTSTENSHLSRGLPGSTLSTSPVASSIGRSSACRYTVAELALNHTPGGRLAWAMASPITCVENSRD